MNRRQFIRSSIVSSSILLTGLPVPVFGKNRDEPFLINAGIGGNNTVDLLARIDKDCLSHKPDLTLLMVGSNDMNSMKFIPLTQFEENLRSIILRIKSVKSKIILMTILPVYEPYLYTRHNKAFYEPEGFQERKAKMNQTIQRLASEYKLTLLDMHHLFERIGNIGEEKNSLIQNELNSGKTDGLHPTSDGYKVMATALYECIIHSGLPHNKIVCFGDSITAGEYPGYLKQLLFK
jgi:lysophospholipase L1-like esterase